MRAKIWGTVSGTVSQAVTESLPRLTEGLWDGAIRRGCFRVDTAKQEGLNNIRGIGGLADYPNLLNSSWAQAQRNSAGKVQTVIDFSEIPTAN